MANFQYLLTFLIFIVGGGFLIAGLTLNLARRLLIKIDKARDDAKWNPYYEQAREERLEFKRI